MPLPKLELRFDPHDIWIGVYWKPFTWIHDLNMNGRWGVKLYICILPMLPLVLSIWTNRELSYAQEYEIWDREY